MEWVETTGKTVEDAKEAALDQLGVHEDDAEVEVLEAPRVGLFGRMRGEARVRARVRPTRPRPKAERRDRKGSSRVSYRQAMGASERPSFGPRMNSTHHPDCASYGRSSGAMISSSVS